MPAAVSRTPGEKAVLPAADLARTAAAFKCASEIARVRILLTLAESSACVRTLQEALESTQSAVSHHLSLMRYAGIVVARRQGQRRVYSLTEAGQALAGVVARLLD